MRRIEVQVEETTGLCPVMSNPRLSPGFSVVAHCVSPCETQDVLRLEEAGIEFGRRCTNPIIVGDYAVVETLDADPL